MPFKIERYCSLHEISTLTGAGVGLLRALCATGLLPAVRWHVKESDLRVWLRNAEAETAYAIEDTIPRAALQRLGHDAGCLTERWPTPSSEPSPARGRNTRKHS